jgi:peptidoglycan/LPS O-acetylase OafA/YrhL
VTDTRTRSSYGVAIAGGALLWLLTMVLSGRTEAWDSTLYWSVAYPLAIALAGVLGYRAPERPWRWGLSVMLVQALVLALTASGFGLLPLGLVMFAILALPPIGAATLGARIRSRRQQA